MAEHPGVAAADIAERLAMPPAFMAKVLEKLARADFVESRPGRNGGVSLRMNPDDVILLGVIEAVSGHLVLDSCEMEQQCVTQRRTGRCDLELSWLEISAHLRELLAGIRLEQLCDIPEQPPA